MAPVNIICAARRDLPSSSSVKVEVEREGKRTPPFLASGF
jgi:hypothetical protein